MGERPALSPHVAHTLDTESPLHAWTRHRLLGGKPKPPSDPMVKGSVLHNLLLEDGSRIVELPFADYRKDAAKEARDAALAAGKLPCLSEKLDEARATVQRWRENLEAITVDGQPIDFEKGDTEVALEWEVDDVLCHGRLDWLQRDRLLTIDFKTIDGNSSPRACAARIVDSPALFQSAAYTEALDLEDMQYAGRWTVLFLYAETSEPYCLTPIVCNPSMQELAVRKWDRARRLWAQCLRTKRWPSYGTQPIPVEAPAWMLAREMGEGAL